MSGTSHCLLEQETLHWLLSTGWFQKRIHECLYKLRAFFTIELKQIQYICKLNNLTMHIIIYFIIYWGQIVIICTRNSFHQVLIRLFQTEKCSPWMDVKDSDLSWNNHNVWNVQLVGLRYSKLMFDILWESYNIGRICGPTVLLKMYFVGIITVQCKLHAIKMFKLKTNQTLRSNKPLTLYDQEE